MWKDSVAQMQLMLQGLLADRFQLTVRHEKRELTAYVLVVAKLTKDGVKMHPVENSAPSYRPYGGAEGRHIRGRITMPNLAGYLSYQVGGPVSDKTGLDGVYDITLDFSVDETRQLRRSSPPCRSSWVLSWNRRKPCST
jgi:uncharacterized protein (TIGR03435 family)